MDRFHAVRDSLLIVPSSTMAEHISHEIARNGFAVRPSRVVTLAGFLDTIAPPTPALFELHLGVEDGLARLRPARFSGVAEFRGFRERIARLIQQVSPDVLDGDLARLMLDVEERLASRGLALRHRRLERAAANPGALPPHLVFDGFFSFSRPEFDLLRTLKSRTDLTVTLPDFAPVRGDLLACGFNEQRFGAILRYADVSSFAAATLDHEVEEIARRVIEEVRGGRAFREIGVILRAREPYAPALETAFARFGIPARFYFADPLIAHPAIAFFAAVIRAMLGGWKHDDLLAIAQMPIAGLNDRFDFDLRQRLPGAGLPLAGLTDPPTLLRKLAELDSWRRNRLPPIEWAKRLRMLRTLLPELPIEENILARELRARQSTALALKAFDEAMARLGEIGEEAASLADFWARAETLLAVESLRIPDRRANVVHVFDVFEARQWELPVVFVCGLTEGHFPQYHDEDPLRKEADRRRAGLASAAELQEEEQRLFQIAATRATAKTIFSYARFNEKGDSTTPSALLKNATTQICDERVYPRPLRSAATRTPAPIQDADLLAKLAKAHQILAPTSIESFLQCPFQFFAGKTLRLRSRPKAPRERLDMLLQGSILHRALAELTRAPLLGTAVFDHIFEEECQRARVPGSYRTEAVRLEMRRHFTAFLEDMQVSLGWPSRVEEEFGFALNPLLKLRGRIDRIDLGPRDQALVIDYKYSAANKIRERTAEDQAENFVQGGLYLLAAARQFGLKPAGMLYCGVRKGVVWDGWHVAIPGLEHIGESVTREALDQMTQAAADKAMLAFEAIASGRIAAHPADEKKCAWCDFADICRVETIGAKRAATAQ
jgi:RecB family exonuclease